MKVLVIGSGGREHTLVWKITQSPKVSQVYCAPGNAGISRLAQCVNIDADSIEKLINFAQKEKIDLTVVGPELPLSQGIVNEFNKQGLRIFGPSKEAAEIESSKVFSKYLLKKYNIPTANYQVFQNSEKALDYIRKQTFPLVIKADGLAAGKGVFIIKNLLEARDALAALMEEKKFGEAGRQVIIEEFLEGEEVSILAFCDGKTVIPMVSSQDHKKIFDNDLGPNTGGMGAYSPVPFYPDEFEKRVLREILKPTIKGLQREGKEYKGVLYAGLILTKEGPKVLEFNARFGDPETQAILPRLKTDLIDIFNAVIEDTLHKINIEWEDNASVCVVMASGGYPDKYQKGKVIKGLERLEKMKDMIAFHAGTKFQDNQVITSGGRVLGITAWDETISKAKEKAYKAVKEIYFEDMYYRKDIAAKAIKEKKQMTKIKRALISVSDKEGLIDFAKGLEKSGIEIISTGGTARLLKDAHIKVKLISEVTNFPEILDGRVKTLHPLIFGGILARSDNPLHQEQLAAQQIEPIGLVVVNLYPFQKTISKEEVKLEEAIENIDIGGPSLLRAAAKNYQDVTVVINPRDYPIILEELEKNQGEISLETKKRLATEVFEHTSFYDGIISQYLRKNLLKESTYFPHTLNLLGEKVSDLRYGENPHQSASFYKEVLAKEANLGDAVQLGGKELSFNNLVDLGAVLEMVIDFQEPTVVFVKHTNPCGLASASTIEEAYQKAYRGDPLSAYGSIIGINRVVGKSLADLIDETPFVEAVLAPDFEDEALDILRQKKNRRLIKVGDLKNKDVQVKDIKKIPGGFLVQDRNIKEITIEDLKVVTNRKPNRKELEELLFAWKAAKQVKSNAIVLTKDKQTVGIGAGQMSRVDSVLIAIRKSEGRSKGSYLASDAFFPFRDGIDEAAKAGVTAIIQPGGSKRDEEVIVAANEHNLAMVFTGVRCFKH